MIGETFYLNETRGGFETWMIATVPGRSFNLDGGGRLVLFGPERTESGLGMRLQLLDYELPGRDLDDWTTGHWPVIVFQIIELKDRIEVRASCFDLWPVLADWFRRILEIVGETWPGSRPAPALAAVVIDAEEPILHKRKGRGTSAETDANALKAYRLKMDNPDMHNTDLAERYSVCTKTIGRWMDRAKRLTEGT